MMKKKDKLEIVELFLAKSGWNRTFIGKIIRNKDSVYGKIPVRNFIICASADTQQELGKKLDEIVTLILDHNIMDVEPLVMFPIPLADKFGNSEIIRFHLN